MARSRDSDEAPGVRDNLDFHDYGDSPPPVKQPRGGFDTRHKPSKPGLATAAAILWLIWGVGGTVAIIAGVMDLLTPVATLPARAYVVAIIQLASVAVGTLLCLAAGVRTLAGATASTGTYGLLSLIYSIVFVTAYSVLVAYLASESADGYGQRGSISFNLLATTCGLVLALMSGMFVAGTFGMAANAKYVEWWGATRGKKQYRSRHG